ncbi:MAG: DUF5000 domain-containing lipoprotein [Bacteroidales bacterium]
MNYNNKTTLQPCLYWYTILKGCYSNKSKVFPFSWILLMMNLLMVGCMKEDDIGQQPLDSLPPSAPLNAQVENLNGGAMISYTIPDEEDLLYIKAVYDINGQIRESKSTVYSNRLEVSGFGDTLTHEVQLISVDRSRNESEPLLVRVKPLTPPIKLIFKSFKMINAFGGVQLSWENKANANVIISLMAADSTGTLRDAENIYTSVEGGKYSLRGFDTSERKFAVYARDRWDNYSDTLVASITPYFERKLDRTMFKAIKLPGDASTTNWSVSNIWDDIVNVSSGFWHSSADDSLPLMITFDLGVDAQLSRYKLWHRPQFYYTHNNLRKWEVYGSSFPNPDGSLDDSWVLLSSDESYKPSGDGPITNEDTEYVSQGEEFEFPVENPSVRYIRVVINANWSGGSIGQISEMAFWGDIVE